MSITGSNNPYACEPVIFSKENTIISLGTITRDGNEFTFSVGFVWNINGITYQNTAPVVITIAEATLGFNRIDNALLNTSNSIELQQGLESETIALQPTYPNTFVLLTQWNISGATIGDSAPVVLGTAYQKKVEAGNYADFFTTGTNKVIPLQPDGKGVYTFVNTSLISIDGFDFSLIESSPSPESPYQGKLFFVQNIKATPLTLRHIGAGASQIKFLLENETDLVIPPYQNVMFMYRPTVGVTHYLSQVFKSWIEETDPVFSASEAALFEEGDKALYDANLSAEANAKAYADTLVLGLLDDRGNYNPNSNSNLYPSTGGSGTAGAILKGDLYTINGLGNGVEALIGTKTVTDGNFVRALVDAPGQTEANWVVTENNFGYTPENTVNKTTAITGNETSDIKFPTVKAIYDWATGLFQAILTAVNFGAFLDALNGKSNLVDTDQFVIKDSQDSNKSKSVYWSELLTNIGAYFTPLYNLVYQTWILGINTISGITYQVGLTDYKTKNVFTNANPIAFTVPTNAVEAIAIGTKFSYSVQGAGTVTVAGAGVTFIKTELAFRQGTTFILEKIATDTWTVYGSVSSESLYYNTVLTGVQAFVVSKYVLRTLLLKESGVAWTDADADLYIHNFRIVGTEVRCYITLPYKHNNSAFRGVNTNGTQLLTHYYDYDGKCTSMGFQVFRDNINLKVLEFYGMLGTIASSQISGCTALTTAIFPKADTADFGGLTALTTFNLDSCTTFWNFENCSLIGTDISNKLPRVKFITGGNFLSGTTVQKVHLPEVLEIGGFINATSLTELGAPKVKKIINTFRNANALTKLYFPECESVAAVARTFEMDAVTLIYLPKCKVFGTEAVADGFFTGRTTAYNLVTLVVNEYLKTSNGGGVNANVADAIALGINVKYASDYPVTPVKTVKDALSNTLGTFDDVIQIDNNFSWNPANKRLQLKSQFLRKEKTILGALITDNILLFKPAIAITITAINVTLKGGTSPSITLQILKHANRNDVGTNVVSSVSVTGGTSETTGSNLTIAAGTIAANEYVWIVTPTVGAAPDSYDVVIDYTINN
ncbi:MAG: Flavobacterium phage vB FspS laban6 [Bacteroidota bacterium]|jgi:hypothetical protein